MVIYYLVVVKLPNWVIKKIEKNQTLLLDEDEGHPRSDAPSSRKLVHHLQAEGARGLGRARPRAFWTGHAAALVVDGLDERQQALGLNGHVV